MKIIVAVSAITLICASACAETYVNADGKMKLRIGKKDAVTMSEAPEYSNPKDVIRTESGQIFIVSLDSNRTTGYGWQIEQPFDNLALESLGVEYVKEPSDMMGVGGREKWTFRALVFRKEFVPLSFKYVRPWEKDEQPAKMIAFKVVINKGPAERQLESMQKAMDKMRNNSWDEHLGQ